MNMTLVSKAKASGARKFVLIFIFVDSLLINFALLFVEIWREKMFVVCLDGSLPAYHLHRGFGAGENNWLLQFEVLCTQLSLNYLRHAHLYGKDVVIYTAMFMLTSCLSLASFILFS